MGQEVISGLVEEVGVDVYARVKLLLFLEKLGVVSKTMK